VHEDGVATLAKRTWESGGLPWQASQGVVGFSGAFHSMDVLPWQYPFEQRLVDASHVAIAWFAIAIPENATSVMPSRCPGSRNSFGTA
jgi:hypothetical protein